MLVLLFVALWFVLRDDLIAWCYFVLVVFRLFDLSLFGFVWFCLFPLPLGV